jgi:hypothetical protein
MKLQGHLNAARYELRNAVTQNLSSAPSSPVAGLRYYDTTSHLERFHNGTTWVDIGGPVDVSNITGLGALATLSAVGSAQITDGSIVNVDISASAAIALSKLATDPLARANHTGTQLAATVSDFDTQVRTSRLDQMAAPTGPLSVGTQRLTNVATPVSGTDAANMAYVDSVAQGLDIKTAVRAATTGNITLSGAQTIDGVSVIAGDRVLVKAQSTGSQNGIYVAAAGAWARATDADTSAEVKPGMFTFVAEGTAGGDKGYVLTTDAPITLNTTALTFTQFSGSGSVTGTASRISVTGNQVDIDAAYVGQTSITTTGTITTGTWTGTTIAVANGGTGATTAAGARANLGTTGKYSSTFGDGAALTYTITHSLGTTAVVVEIFETATGITVYCDVTHATTNTLTIDGFTTAPASGALTVVVLG